MPPARRRSVFLARLPLPERKFIADVLRTETLGGVLILLAAVVALILANTPLSGLYTSVRDFHLGPESLHLNLSVGEWAKDGLLTIFFFVVGIELKRELVTGELRNPAAAALPIIAAVCGMAVPAAVYTVTAGLGGGDLSGWAVPMATDIAFALAVLAVIGTGLPTALRAFLLTLAVADDLGAILVIAVFFTSEMHFPALGGALAGLAVCYALLRANVRGWYVYVPLGLVIWGLTHASGVHATVSGVAMGLMLRCRRREGEESSPAERIEHQVRPLSAGFVVPVFAVFAAGVPVSASALAEVFERPEPLGVVLGLFLGKLIGVFGGSWLTARFTRAQLSDDLKWADLFAVSVLAGIGFTVALLIGDLAFPGDPQMAERVKAAVLMGSLISALVAAVLLRVRANHYRRLVEEEERDEDGDSAPGIHRQGDPDRHTGTAEIHESRARGHREAAGSPCPAAQGDRTQEAGRDGRLPHKRSREQ